MIHVWAVQGDWLLSVVCERADLAVLAAQYNGVYKTVTVRDLRTKEVRVLHWPGGRLA